jgi:hypothetical protein
MRCVPPRRPGAQLDQRSIGMAGLAADACAAQQADNAAARAEPVLSRCRLAARRHAAVQLNLLLRLQQHRLLLPLPEHSPQLEGCA